MALNRLLILVLGLALTVIALVVFVISKMHDAPLLEILTVASFLLFAGVVFSWMGFGFYLMYVFVPKVDAIVDPNVSAINERWGDSVYSRAHRLLLYGFSASSRWANRRLHPGFDFTTLTHNLKTPLKVFFHWHMLSVLLLAIGYILTVIVEQ